MVSVFEIPMQTRVGKVVSRNIGSHSDFDSIFFVVVTKLPKISKF